LYKPVIEGKDPNSRLLTMREAHFAVLERTAHSPAGNRVPAWLEPSLVASQAGRGKRRFFRAGWPRNAKASDVPKTGRPIRAPMLHILLAASDMPQACCRCGSRSFH